MTFPAISTDAEGRVSAAGDITMTVDEIIALFAGLAPVDDDDPGFATSVEEMLACTSCGLPIIHAAQHLKFHGALATLATLVQRTLNATRPGQLSDDDQREADLHREAGAASMLDERIGGIG